VGRGGEIEIAGRFALVCDERGALPVDIEVDTVEAVGDSGEGAERLGRAQEGQATREGLGQERVE